MQNMAKWSNIDVIEVTEGEGEKNGAEPIFLQ